MLRLININREDLFSDKTNSSHTRPTPVRHPNIKICLGVFRYTTIHHSTYDRITTTSDHNYDPGQGVISFSPGTNCWFLPLRPGKLTCGDIADKLNECRTLAPTPQTYLRGWSLNARCIVLAQQQTYSIISCNAFIWRIISIFFIIVTIFND